MLSRCESIELYLVCSTEVVPYRIVVEMVGIAQACVVGIVEGGKFDCECPVVSTCLGLP